MYCLIVSFGKVKLFFVLLLMLLVCAELKNMVEEEQKQHQPLQQTRVGLFERRHRRSLSDDMRLDLGKLSTRKEDPSSLYLGAHANLQPFFIKVTALFLSILYPFTEQSCVMPISFLILNCLRQFSCIHMIVVY